MPSTTTKPNAPAIDGRPILKKLTAGFQTKATKRAGKTGFTLIQREGRTLAMASIRQDGAIRLEGNRLGKALRVETASELTAARKVMESIAKANASKVAPKKSSAKGKSPEPAAEPTVAAAAAGINPTTKARVAAAEAKVNASGQRARSRQEKGVGSKVA